MSSSRTAALAFAVACTLAAGVLVHAGQQGSGQLPSPFPMSLGLRERGSSVTGALEGWYRNKDGSTSILVGYLNRNSKQELDIPIGPQNRIEPGGPDQGQPTHFQSGRQWGVFSVKVPKDFGDKKLTWTIVANGLTNTITLHTKPDYLLEPYEDAASKNTPPVIKFEANGPAFTGPPVGIAANFTTPAGQPLTLTAWATDEGAKVNVPPPMPGGSGAAPASGPPAPGLKWSVFRGSGAVKFDPANPRADKDNGGRSTTTATFATAGEYILRLQANDSTGEGGAGFQCCWTNAHVKVIVTPSSTTTTTTAAAAPVSAPASTAASSSALASAEASAFLGEWTLNLDSPQGAFVLTLHITDANGKTAAELTTAMQPAPQKVTDISKSEIALVLKYSSEFQGSAFAAKITMTPDGDNKAKILFDVADGQFQMHGTGTKK